MVCFGMIGWLFENSLRHASKRISLQYATVYHVNRSINSVTGMQIHRQTDRQADRKLNTRRFLNFKYFLY